MNKYEVSNNSQAYSQLITIQSFIIICMKVTNINLKLHQAITQR